MYAIIKDRDGQELSRLTLEPDAPLDCDIYARIFGDSYGLTLIGSEPGATIPDGCEDISITLQEEPGAVTCWTSENYMIEEQ